MISRRGYCSRRHVKLSPLFRLITPVLKGSCRIQGPVDDLDLKGIDTDDKKFMFPKDRSAMKIESGTCTVCSAPCSLCMHHNRESGVSCNLSVRTDADSSSVSNVDVMPIYKSRICDDLPPAASEASNLLSSTSSHDSYAENAESKASLSASAGYDASDDIDMPQVFSDEDRRFAEIDNVECSLASFSGGNSVETKSSPIPNHEVSKTWTKSGFSSGTSNINDLCQDTRSGADCKKPSDNCSEECHVNDLERGDDALDAVKGQNQKMQPQASTVGENYESDVALDDVKVCDICGDAGREDYLATCSKCSDGAEHTYCMREMLDKVPEGEWLCEECKIKETESQNANECEAAHGRLKSACHNDINQDFKSPLIPTQTNKLDDATPTDLDAGGSAKGLQGPQISTRRPVDPLVEGKASELVLSHQISSKNLDMGRMRTARMEPSSEAQLAKGSEAFSCSKTYLKSSSFKGLPPLYSPRGRLSRSVSFNNSNVNLKVKTLIENAPPKQKITREPTMNELRKEGLFKTSTKPMFKNITSECSNTDLASKNPLLQPSRTEDFRALKEVKDRNTVEKKNFSVKGNSFIRPSAAITSNYPLKVDAKSVQSDGIRSNVSETSVCSLSEGLNADSLGSNERKKQISYSSKNIESSSGNYDADNPKGFKVTKEALRRSISSVDGSYRKVEMVSPRRAVQPLESGHKDRRTRDSTIFIGSRLSALGDKRTSHSQGGNETGRIVQDKRGGSAHRTSADQNSRKVEKKGNKWREVVNAAMTKRGKLKGGKSDTFAKLPAISADMICEGASKHTSSASNQRSLVVENNIGKVSSKDSADVSTKTVASIGLAQPAVLPVEASVKADGRRNAPNATELSVKSVAKTLQGEASLLTKPGSAVPKLECIWQGNFNVGTGNQSKMFFGIQAHLSTSASPTVYKLATKVPGNVQLEEVSHISSWPLQLLRTGPQDENIALFFFAKDVESYDRCYRKLMDKMHRHDLALRGNIEGTELLIFTSNKLPMNSQRWNRMHYLWGMFRDKRRYYLPVMGDQKKSLLSNQDFFVPSIADVVSNAQRLETSSKLQKLSDFRSSKVVHGEHTNGVDLSSISSIIEDKTRKTLEVSPVQNLLNEVHAVPKVTQEKPSISDSSSSGTKSVPLRVTSDYANSRLQMTTTKLCSEEKNNGSYQEKFVSDCTNRKVGNSYALTYEIGVESSLSRAPSVPSVSPNCNEGADCINIEENSGEKETSPSLRAIIDDDQRGNVLGADLLGCESTANRKRERSCSMERLSQPSGETSKHTIETVLLRDGPSWFPVEHESDQKKTCYNSGDSDINDATSARLSSKVHPLYSSIMRQEQPVESLCNENVRNTESYFFQIDLGPVQNAKCTNILHIPSKEEDAVESSSPDLELALGGKSKSTKLFSFPSLFHSADGGKQHWQPGSPGDGDDASASLSLSL